MATIGSNSGMVNTAAKATGSHIGHGVKTQ